MVRFIRNLRYACEGISFAVRTQAHMRIHAIAAILVCGTGALLHLSRIEWAVLVLTIAIVIAAEMINTAVEQAVDRIGKEHHPLAKAAKDVAAGAVLVTAIMAIIVGLLILGPPLWRLLGL